MLWRELQPAVLRYFQVATKEAAEDLAADTWTAVIGRLGRFRADERAFRAWIFTVARHRAIDWHRQAARRPTDSVPAERLSDRRAPDDPASRWWTASRPGRGRPCWPELPVDQAEVVACGSWVGWGWPRWPGSSASARGRCACWPIGACGAWPTGWRWPGCWAV